MTRDALWPALGVGEAEGDDGASWDHLGDRVAARLGDQQISVWAQRHHRRLAGRVGGGSRHEQLGDHAGRGAAGDARAKPGLGEPQVPVEPLKPGFSVFFSPALINIKSIRQ
jgi:hypothetical protein